MKKSGYFRVGMLVLFIVVVVGCFLCFNWMTDSGNEDSNNTAEKISEFYMQEMGAHIQIHFERCVEEYYVKLESIEKHITDEILGDEDELKKFLRLIQEEEQFSYVALVDENGMGYDENGVFDTEGKFEFTEKLLGKNGQQPESRVIDAVGETAIFGISVTPINYEDKEIVAIIGCCPIEEIDSRLFQQNSGRKTYTGIIKKSGDIVVKNVYDNGFPYDTNIFSRLEDSVDFNKGYSLEEMKNDILKNKGGNIIYRSEGIEYYLYYMPLKSMDWYMVLLMPYEKINDMVGSLTDELNARSIVVLAIIVTVFSGVILCYYITMGRNEVKLIAATESAKQERASAVNANLAKSEFLSRMSHEIRTPINGIIGMSNIAIKNIDNHEKVEDCLKKVSISSKHLLSLINDILDVSKIESGKVELNNVQFNINEFIDEVDNIYYSYAKEKGVFYRSRIWGKAEENVVGDQLRLSQIIYNLLSNAIKFTKSGGVVSLTIEQTKEENNQVWLQFEVKDSGCGIKQENYDKIFKSFEQENAGISNNYGGTGLGLSIVKSLTELMGGKLSLFSIANEGSTFTVEIPFEKADSLTELQIEDSKSAESDTEYDFNGKRILIAEDNQINREIAVELIGDATGADIECAEDGVQTVEMFEQSEPGYYDLILMDIQMPNLDGYGATKKIRSLDRSDAASIPIVAMTANAFVEDIAKSKSAGMNGHITKPIDIRTIKAKLKELL